MCAITAVCLLVEKLLCCCNAGIAQLIGRFEIGNVASLFCQSNFKHTRITNAEEYQVEWMIDDQYTIMNND